MNLNLVESGFSQLFLQHAPNINYKRGKKQELLKKKLTDVGAGGRYLEQRPAIPLLLLEGNALLLQAFLHASLQVAVASRHHGGGDLHLRIHTFYVFLICIFVLYFSIAFLIYVFLICIFDLNFCIVFLIYVFLICIFDRNF